MTVCKTLCDLVDSEFKNHDGSWRKDAGRVLGNNYISARDSLHGTMNMMSIEHFISISMICLRFLRENSIQYEGEDCVSLLEKVVAIRFWKVLYTRDNSQEEEEVLLYILECMSNPLGTMGFSSIIPLSETVH